jgi:hypothetical protein
VVTDAVKRVWAQRKKLKLADKKNVLEGDPITLLITPQLVRSVDRLSVNNTPR